MKITDQHAVWLGRGIAFLAVLALLFLTYPGRVHAQVPFDDGRYHRASRLTYCWTPEALAAGLEAIARGEPGPILREIGCTVREEADGFHFQIVRKWGEVAGRWAIYELQVETALGPVYAYWPITPAE